MTTVLRITSSSSVDWSDLCATWSRKDYIHIAVPCVPHKHSSLTLNTLGLLHTIRSRPRYIFSILNPPVHFVRGGHWIRAKDGHDVFVYILLTNFLRFTTKFVGQSLFYFIIRQNKCRLCRPISGWKIPKLVCKTSSYTILYEKFSSQNWLVCLPHETKQKIYE